MSTPKLVVGLGNPGKEYARTRHNFGFLVVQCLASKYHLRFKRSVLLKSYIAEGLIEGISVILLCPRTYMNRSGNAVKAISKRKNIDLSGTLIVCDDLDMNFGRLRLRTKGRDAGHRGLRSIIQTFQTDGFARIKCGIGRPEDYDDVVDHVLSEFDTAENKKLPSLLKKVSEACAAWIKGNNDEVKNILSR